MAAINTEIRRGAYYDSVMLMQLQRALAELPGVIDAGVVMGTDANKDILEQSELHAPEVDDAGAEDLLIVVKAETEEAASAALGQVDELLTRRKSTIDQEYLPKSLDSAAQMLPEAHWVLISTPGQHAAGVARDALRIGKHVFLYSDNVSVEDEVSLKAEAADKGLLVMGPDCGTANVNGIGLGFANVVRRGPIGIVAASGTGLQQVATQIHQLGSGMTHGFGTGGRDLSEAVEAATTLQALDVLTRDPDTKVIVLVSKPPARAVAQKVLRAARLAGKPVVVDFIGYESDKNEIDNLHFVSTLDGAARKAVQLSKADAPGPPPTAHTIGGDFVPGQKYLRGLYSGGTLAYEALLILRDMLPDIYSNIHLESVLPLENVLESQLHTVIDLGEDVFTVGRLHPMMDNDLRIRRLLQEAEDPETAVILLDVVLGYGSHPDPASELAPAIIEARAIAEAAGRHLEFVVEVVGTDEDPQDFGHQIKQLKDAKVQLFTSNEAAVHYAGELVQELSGPDHPPVSLDIVNQPLAAINVGLESFAESLTDQGAPVIHVDWKPPAGGNERLAAILARMRGA